MGLRAPNSKFVTNTAWALIAVSSLGAAVSVLQLIVFVLFFPAPEQRVPATNTQPGAEWLLAHLGPMIVGMLMINLFALVASVGFLKRKRWAYLLILGFCYLGVAASAAAIVGLPFLGVAPISWILPALFNAGMIWLNLWISRKLRTPMISGEFAS